MPRKSQFTDEQIIRAIREVDGGAKVPDVARRRSVTEKTFYHWRQWFGGLDNEALRLVVSKMVTPTIRRQVVCLVQEAMKMSERRACRTIGVSRASYRYTSTKKEPRALALDPLRFGYASRTKDTAGQGRPQAFEKDSTRPRLTYAPA
jgi:hypothetical protein